MGYGWYRLNGIATVSEYSKKIIESKYPIYDVIVTPNCISDFAKIGGLCNTAEEFIASINQNHGTFINEYSLAIFKDQYSTESFTEKLKNFLINE